jgi:hypothetical protein
MPAKVLTEKASRYITREIKQSKRVRINTPRNYLNENALPIPSSSESHFALTPPDGIPKMENILYPILGKAWCPIYKAFPDDVNPDNIALYPIMQESGVEAFELPILNVEPYPIPGDTYVNFHRTKSGEYLARYPHMGSHYIRFTLTQDLTWEMASASAQAYDAWDGPVPTGTIQVYNHDTNNTGIYNFRGKNGYKGTAVWDSKLLRFRITYLETYSAWRAQVSCGAMTKETASANGTVSLYWGGGNPGTSITVHNVTASAGNPEGTYLFECDAGATALVEFNDELLRWQIYQLECKITSPGQAIRRVR